MGVSKEGIKGEGYKKFYLTLRISTDTADEAAFLIDEHVAALRALPGQVLGQAVVLRPGLTVVITGMLFQHAGNGIGAGEDRLALFPGNGRAADTAELFYQRGDLDSSPQR